jgi:hypothetical protein
MKRFVLPALLMSMVFGHAALAQTAQTPIAPSVSESTTSAPPAFPAEPAAPHCGGCYCGPDGRIWAEADYLLWWVRGAPLPPLVTTSPAGTPQSQAGVLGTPGVHVLFGGSLSDGAARSGGRITIGAWLDPDQTIGIEANYFALEAKANTYLASSNGSAILARPFLNANTGLQDAALVSFPGVASGSIDATSTSTLFENFGLLARQNVCCGDDYRVDLVAGYRYMRFTDDIDIDQTLVALSAVNNVAPGTTLNVGDRFNAANQLNAFDVGLTGEARRGPWTFGWVAKIAVGQNHETIDVNGATVVTVPTTPPVTNTGGFLALPTNIGHFKRDVCSFVPELGVKVCYQITSGVRVNLGYNFLYWDNVVRAGQQIDTQINSNLLPPPISSAGPARPAPQFENTNIWVQGINLGVELRF